MDYDISDVLPVQSPEFPVKTAVDPSLFATPVAIIIAAVMISGSILYSGGGTSGTAAIGDDSAGKPAVVDMKGLEDDDPVLGSEDAPVTIVEFSDFQCPFCRQFFNATFAQLKEKYIDTGKAKLVFRDFPLEFHPAALPTAIAAECADDQGKFWQFHDVVFQEQSKSGSGTVTYGAPELKQWARQIGLDGGTFDKCLDSSKHADEVKRDFEAGQKAGVSGTPSFVINGKLLIGAQPFSAFQEAIEAGL